MDGLEQSLSNLTNKIFCYIDYTTILPRFRVRQILRHHFAFDTSREDCVSVNQQIRPIMPPKLKFGEGERILCYHGPLIYEAKCMKGQLKDKVTKYLIHYNGWNKNWDEWVPENRVLKFNEANLQKQRELREQNLYVLKIFQRVFSAWVSYG